MKIPTCTAGWLAQGCCLFPLFCICCLFIPDTGLAQTVVAGNYLKKSGKEIVLQLNIGRPAPTSIIVTQYIPGNTGVISSSPPHKKYNKGKGELTWLIKHPSPGKQRIQLKLHGPGIKSVSASVRFMDPVSGAMKSVSVN
jgi:hypothetical protein